MILTIELVMLKHHINIEMTSMNLLLKKEINKI